MGPIILIAFTNHALDHMLCSVLDAKITQKIVRLGSRSADPRIAMFSMEEIESVQNQSRLRRTGAANHKELVDCTKRLSSLMNELVDTSISSESLCERLEITHSDHMAELHDPPQWVKRLRSIDSLREQEGTWVEIGRNGKAMSLDSTLYGFWKSGRDLSFLQQPRSEREKVEHPTKQSQNPFENIRPDDDEDGDSSEASSYEDSSSDEDELSEDVEVQWRRLLIPDMTLSSDDDQLHTSPALLPKVVGVSPISDAALHSVVSPADHVSEDDDLRLSDLSDVEGFFNSCGLSHIPLVPSSQRSIEELLEDSNMWNMSLDERLRLDDLWEANIRELLHSANMEDYEDSREQHTECLRRQDEHRNEVGLAFPVRDLID